MKLGPLCSLEKTYSYTIASFHARVTIGDLGPYADGGSQNGPFFHSLDQKPQLGGVDILCATWGDKLFSTTVPLESVTGKSS